MGTKTSIGLGLALLLMVLAVVLRFGIADPDKIEAAQRAAQQEAAMDKTNPPNKTEKLQGSDNDMGVSPSQHDSHQHVDDRDVVNTEHLDQLSPEMKQAIKDKLLLHGPMEVIHHSDGSFELPSNGRFTQMPVAVQMPDGSIQIREYSYIPD